VSRKKNRYRRRLSKRGGGPVKDVDVLYRKGGRDEPSTVISGEGMGEEGIIRGWGT